MYILELKSGDKIKFGKKYCVETGQEDLLNKIIMLTPQYFEEDNGLYTYQSECPGICLDENEPDSIFHLFGNDLEYFYDCEHIPATEDDLLVIKKLKEDEDRAFQEETERMVEFFEKQNT